MFERVCFITVGTRSVPVSDVGMCLIGEEEVIYEGFVYAFIWWYFNLKEFGAISVVAECHRLSFAVFVKRCECIVYVFGNVCFLAANAKCWQFDRWRC